MENQIQKAISNLKIEALNEMQVASIEANKGQEDCVLLSPTGSGKTLAFLLPLLYNPTISSTSLIRPIEH